MHIVSRHGPVVRIRMATAFLGRPILWVNAYWVDGLLIDTGCRKTVPDLLAALRREGLKVEQLINTHSHEDHAGGNRAVAQAYGVQPRIHPLGLERLSAPETAETVRFYRRFTWGLAEPCPGAPLGQVAETDRYRFRVVHTPGHAPEHVVLFEEQEGWAFTGDLMLSPRSVLIRYGEQPMQMLESMRVAAALPIRRLFCAHAARVSDSAEPFQAKIALWERLLYESRALADQGRTTEQITRALLSKGTFTEWFSGGDYHRRHLIDGFVQGGGRGAPA